MSSKLSLLGSIGTGQVPTDLFYIDDLSLGAAGSLSITLNNLFSVITRNITDGAVRFQAFAAPAVSAATQGAIYFDSATNRLLFSENGGAYIRVGNVTGPAAATDEALARFDAATGRILQNSAITLSDTGALTFPDDVRQVFNPGANVSGLNVGAFAGDPGTPIDGDVWYDSANTRLRARVNGATITVSNGDVVGPAGATDEAIARFDTATGKLIQNSVVTISDAGAFAFPDDIRQTFNPGANASGFNAGSVAADPGTPTNGDVWYNSTTNALRARINGATVSLGAGGGGTPGGADTQVQFNNAGAFGGVTGATSNGTNVTFGSNNLIATSPIIGTAIEDSNGNEQISFTVAASAVNQLDVANSATGVGVTLATAGDDANIVMLLAPKGTARLESSGPLRLSGSGSDTFTTPTAAGIPTKINVPLYNPGAFGQILAMGLDSAATSSARVITLLDQRAAGHQPTLIVLTPDETNFAGLTWNGSNSEFTIRTSISGTPIIRMDNGTIGSILALIPPGSSPNGWLSVTSGNAGSIALQVDSANTPTVDIARFTINGLVTAGNYAGVSLNAYFFDAGRRRNTAQFDRTSSTALTSVTGLSTTVTNGKIYKFVAELYTVSDVAGGVKFGINSTGGASAFIAEAIVFDAGAIAVQSRTTTNAAAIGGVTAVTNAYCRISGSVAVSGNGSLRVEFAQNASSGTPSSVLVGSTFFVEEIS